MIVLINNRIRNVVHFSSVAFTMEILETDIDYFKSYKNLASNFYYSKNMYSIDVPMRARESFGKFIGSYIISIEKQPNLENIKIESSYIVKFLYDALMWIEHPSKNKT